jgi:FeS assembly SUF system protein
MGRGATMDDSSKPQGQAPDDRSPLPDLGKAPDLRDKIIEALQTCFDPEIPVNIYELGLIYDIDIKPAGEVGIKMTLTSPMCPVAGSLPPEVEAKIGAVPGVKSAKVEVVWEPPWTPEKMTEAARLMLGMM